MDALREINRDLAMLTSQQGEMLQTIEGNVSDGAVRVEVGAQELGKADKLASSARKKIVIIILMVLGLLAVLAILGIVIWKVFGPQIEAKFKDN